METSRGARALILKKMFKSYYVVWKLTKTNTKTTGKNTFKSYYVVWKPKNRRTPLPTALLFKSYYVVWKPCAITALRVFKICLNRTM